MNIYSSKWLVFFFSVLFLGAKKKVAITLLFTACVDHDSLA